MRPLNDAEAEKGSAWRIDGNQLLPLLGTGQHASDSPYTLDYVFDKEWSTRAVYGRTTEDIVKKASSFKVSSGSLPGLAT